MPELAGVSFPVGLKCTSLAWNSRQVSFRASRKAYCPIGRSTTIWIGQHSSGNSSGGGGAGTAASPYLCNTFADLCTFWPTIDAADVCVKFVDGSVFRGATGSLAIAFAMTTFTRTGTTDTKPCFTGYQPDTFYGGSWGQDGSSRWLRNLGTAINWTHDNLDVLQIEAGTNRVWTKCSDLTTFDAHVVATYGPAFYVTGTSVYVKYNAGNTSPAGLVEFNARIAIEGQLLSLVNVADVDGCHINGIVFHGSNMDGANSDWCVDSVLSGTNMIQFSDCVFSHSGTHHVVNHNLTSGGICYFYNNKFSGLLVDATGSAFAITAYAFSGQHECICDLNIGLHGVLPDMTSFGWNSARRKRGGLIYAHEGNGTTTTDLFMACYNVVNDHQYGFVELGSNGGAANVNRVGGTTVPYDPTVHNRTRLLTHGRSFWFGNTNNGSVGIYPQWDRNYEVTMWERYPNATAWVDHTAGEATMGNPALQKHAVYIGCSEKHDYSGITATSAALRQVIDLSMCEIDFVQCGEDIRNKNTNTIAWNSADSASGVYMRVRRFNGILSINQSAANNYTVWARNQQPTLIASGADSTIAGGHLNCAYYLPGTTMVQANFGSPPGAGAYDGMNAAASAPVTLASAWAQGTVPASGDGSYQGASTLVHDYSDMQWWIDSAGVTRTFSGPPSIGPEQPASNPVNPGQTAFRVALLRRNLRILFEEEAA